MKTILVLTNFSKKSEHAARYALHIARNIEADILLFNAFVVPKKDQETKTQKFVWALEEYFCKEDQVKKQLSEFASHLKNTTEEIGSIYQPSITFLCQELEPGKLGENVRNVAEQRDAWMVVMGGSETDCFSNFISGTNSYSVMSHAVCPVLFVPLEAHIKKIEKIAISTNGVEEHLEPLPFVQELKDTFNVEVLNSELFEDGSVNTYIAEEVRGENSNSAANREFEDVKLQNEQSRNFEDDCKEILTQSGVDVFAVVYYGDMVFNHIYNGNIAKSLKDEYLLPLLVLPATLEHNNN
jgi:nucleotide-binding universal stress UspA family protein